MSLGFFRRGTEISLEGHKYLMERRLDSGHWVLQHLVSGRPLERHQDELLKDYAEDALTFTRLNVVSLSGKSNAAPPSAAAYKPNQIQGAERRRMYVSAVEALPRSKRHYEEAIQAAWVAGHQATPKPNWITVVRWVKSVELSGGSFAGLVANDSGKGNREPRTHSDVVACCQWVIDNYYLTELKPTFTASLHFAEGEIERENKLRPRSGRLATPSRKLFRRLLALIPAYDRDVARLGREVARRKYRTRLHIRLSERPLQRAEVDHSLLDIFLVDDLTGAPLGRPWLTVIIDDFTRCILGYALTFEPPSCASVAKALKSAFKPKFAKDRYPAVENEWFAFGVPAELAADNALEFHALELQQICLELGCVLNFAPRKTPWFKGKVEKFNKTVNIGALTNIPGKTFSNIIEKEDYDPAKHAVMRKNELEALLNKFFCDIYHQKPHLALGCSPAEMWRKHIDESSIGFVPDFSRFDAILGERHTRVLSHAGIQYMGLFYNSKDMEAIRKSEGAEIQVEIRIDRGNLGSIVVLSPRTKEPIRVKCLSPEYAEGLSQWQHKVCKAYASKNRKEGVDPETLDAWKVAHADICCVAVRLLQEKAKKPRTPLPAGVARWTDNLEYHLGMSPTRALSIDPTEWRSEPTPTTAAPLVVAEGNNRGEAEPQPMAHPAARTGSGETPTRPKTGRRNAKAQNNDAGGTQRPVSEAPTPNETVAPALRKRRFQAILT